MRYCPTGHTAVLILIKDWDINRMGLPLCQALSLPCRNVVHVTYTYDNSGEQHTESELAAGQSKGRESFCRRDGAPLASGTAAARE